MKPMQFVTIILSFLVLLPTYAAPESINNIAIEKKQSDSLFKGLMYDVWVKLRAFNAKNVPSTYSNNTVATIGIRGSSAATESTLQPYWKDDLTHEDDTSLTEADMFNIAKYYMDNGQLDKAQIALNDFLRTFPNSNLKPNVVFSAGMIQSGLGNKDRGIRILYGFVKQNPNHPLATDAKLVIKNLINKSKI